MHRVPDVLDTWFDSGSMPYGERHYPFENKEKFDAAFPAQFIAEGVDQTRCWFYYLHVIATGIKETKAFQNVVVNGIVLAEDGRKMSKKLKNYPDPMEILNKYGSDVLRYYLMSSPVVAAENLNFSERDMSDIQRGVFRMLWNSYSFFTTYAAIDNWEPKTDAKASDNLLDRWILSELQLMTREVNAAMEAYELNRATRAFTPFVDNLSNWYIRRSRKRFWKSEDDGDKEQAYQTLYEVLKTLAKLMAPFTPFIAEEIYRNLTGEESVHLAEYPVADEGLVQNELVRDMTIARTLVSIGLSIRSEQKLKVRQPLSDAVVFVESVIDEELVEIIKEELNVEAIRQITNRDEFNTFLVSDLMGGDRKYLLLRDDEKKLENKHLVNPIAINGFLSPELKLKGEAREIIRAIQEGRKKAGFNVDDRISLGYTGKDAVFANTELAEIIQHEVLATTVQSGTFADADYTETIDIEGESFVYSLKRNI